MSDVPLHRLYLHYSELPYSLRALYTATLLVLGLAYLFAGIYLYHSYSGKDGNPITLSYDDIVIAYSGSGKGSRLEAALRGPMRSMLPAEEITPIITWVQEGSDRTKYEQAIKPEIEKRCATCHDGSNPHLPNLVGYDNLQKVTETDTGTGIFTLVRVSHIHLFGITFVFFALGLIFSHAYVRPVWFKVSAIVLPYVCLTLDIASWYFTKLYHPFAAVVIVAGGVMALSFTYMWAISMYQLWFSGIPSPVTLRRDSATPPVG